MKQCITNWSWTNAGKKSSIVRVFNWLFPILTLTSNSSSNQTWIERAKEKSRFSLSHCTIATCELFGLYFSFFFICFVLEMQTCNVEATGLKTKYGLKISIKQNVASKCLLHPFNRQFRLWKLRALFHFGELWELK